MVGGASAAADYAANKTIAISDLRGRVRAGDDNMGGSAAGRLTAVTMTPDGVTLGATGGAQTETASVSGTFPGGAFGGTGSGTAVGNVNTGAPFGDTILFAAGAGNGTGTSHQHNLIINIPVSVTTSTSVSGAITGTTAAATNVQSTMIVSAIIKL